MMVHFQVFILLVFLAFIFGALVGGAIEYCQRGGTYDLRKDLNAAFRENERLREELYFAGQLLGSGNHPANRAHTSVHGVRPHLSLVQSEPGA